MKKNYIIFLLAILFSGISIAQETQKNFINYQGVARNGADQLMANETISIGIAMKMGSTSGASAYAENHSVTTDANGVFRLKIGNGETISGEYNTIPWGSEAAFLTVLVNGTEIGTTEMMAVPYALSSGDGAQQADEVPYDNSVSGLVANNAQEAIDELVGSGVVDADTDPTNEIQDISLTGTDLTISEGSTIDLSAIVPPGGTDDQDASEVAFDNTASGLVATDAQAAIDELATSGLVDTDNQDLSLSGTTLQITDGTGVDLAAIIPPGGTDDQDASEVTFDNTASGLVATDAQAAIDELATSGVVDTDNQTLILTDDVLTIEDGAGSVDLSVYGDDADADPTNEIDVTTETGILLGDGATVTGLLGTADGQVAKWNANNSAWEAGTDETSIGGGSSLWGANGSDVFYEDGNVGVGTSDISASLHVKKNLSSLQPLLILEEESDGFARIAIRNEGIPALWNILGRSYNPIANAEISTINFRYINGLGGQEDVMSISGNRRVGINTVAPTANLDVVGNIRSSSLGAGGNVVADTDGNLIIGAGDGSSLWSENEGNLYYNGGNVGIGTDSPSVPFEVSTSNERPIVLRSTDDNNYMQYITPAGAVGYSGVWTGNQDVDFGTTDSNETGKVHLTTSARPKLTVAANGDIGIGTQNPTAKTHVLHNSGLTSPQLRLEESETDYARLEFKNQDRGYWHIAGRGGEPRDVSRLNFYHNDGASGRNYMTIAGSGNIGIGTTNPQAALDIVGGARVRGLSGTDRRNVMADPEGNLVIGSGGGVSKIDDLLDGKSDASGSSVFLGQNAGANDDGTNNNNVGIGFDAHTASTTAVYNVAVGYTALSENTTGSANTAVGSETLVRNTTGTGNTATGRGALFANIAGDNNTAIGLSSNSFTNYGDDNTSVGTRSLRVLDIGDENTAVGSGSLYNLTYGTNNIGIGFNSEVPNGNGSNQVRIGNNDITYAGVQVSWTVTSDARWKKNVRELPYGLNMVSQLRPVDYIRKKNSAETREIGFIAQEVKQVLSDLGYADQGILTKDDEGFMSLRYNDFIPVLTKAIQEQQELIQSYKSEQKNILAEIAFMKKQISDLMVLLDQKEVSLKE